ncbi:MAG: MFS transporter [Chloroflexi bacterium]|nr:MAG: MFS transporter [Chloroflexota bacterium]
MTNVRNHPMAALSVLVLGLFMTLLDLTIVNVAIPSILDGLHASLDQVLWVLNAYSLLYAVLLITSARLGDIHGPRKMFAIGVVIFTVASAFSGLAQDPTQLILARGLQGLGSAVLAPQGLPLMMSLFPVEKRGGVFAIYGVIAGLAVIAGPTVGGYLVSHFGWRSIFTVNIPIGVITFALALLLIPDLRPGRKHRLDIFGVALATAGLLGVIYGLIEGQRYDWGVVTGFITIPEIIGAGLVLFAVFLYHQARRNRQKDGEPLLPFEVFKDRNFTLMTLVMAAMGFAGSHPQRPRYGVHLDPGVHHRYPRPAGPSRRRGLGRHQHDPGDGRGVRQRSGRRLPAEPHRARASRPRGRRVEPAA